MESMMTLLSKETYLSSHPLSSLEDPSLWTNIPVCLVRSISLLKSGLLDHLY